MNKNYLKRERPPNKKRSFQKQLNNLPKPIMKKTIFLLLTILTFSCCKDDDNNTPTNPIDQLPEATQIGANTAGCLVDGEAFLPFGNISGGNLNFFYTDGLNFGLSIGEKKNNILRNIGVASLNQNVIVGQTYILGDYGNGIDTEFGEYTINSFPPPNPNYYSTTSLITGELIITHHDFDNAFMSGTFWFDAVNSNGEIVEIREGRFDMEY